MSIGMAEQVVFVKLPLQSRQSVVPGERSGIYDHQMSEGLAGGG